MRPGIQGLHHAVERLFQLRSEWRLDDFRIYPLQVFRLQCVFFRITSRITGRKLTVETGGILAQLASLEVILYGLPSNVFSVLWFTVVGLMVSRYQNLRLYFMVFSSLCPLAGFLGLVILPSDDKYRWTKWGAFVSVFPTPSSLVTDIVSIGRTSHRQAVSSSQLHS